MPDRRFLATIGACYRSHHKVFGPNQRLAEDAASASVRNTLDLIVLR